MKNHLRIIVLMMLAAFCVLPLGLHAGDKEKKQESKETIVPDELNQTDSKDKFFPQSYCKTYTFKMTEGKTYLIDAKSQTFLPSLRIETAAGAVVAQETNGGFNAVLAYRAAKTEDYQLTVTSLNRGVGKFTLNIKEIDAGDGKPIELKNEKGLATYNGNLLNTDPRYNGNKIHKFFTFQMEAGKTYRIDHSSKAFDAYLYLENPDGKVVDQNDDNGESLDSRIVHKADKTGKYRIVATSLGGRGVGAFTLTLRQTDPPVKEENKK